MTPRETDLVTESFALLGGMQAEAGRCFHDRLFGIAPELRPMFPADPGEQAQVLMETLGRIVASLGDAEGLLPVISRLASRHVSYGVAPHHHAIIGTALLASLDDCLGDAFTAETAAAWDAAYGALSQAMIDAAYPELVIAELSAAE
ncbi:MAG: hemin receptor [Rhodobacteraceae bacterium]|nr:hemin receptor [Paracoccaceae bacterium]